MEPSVELDSGQKRELRKWENKGGRRHKGSERGDCKERERGKVRVS